MKIKKITNLNEHLYRTVIGELGTCVCCMYRFYYRQSILIEIIRQLLKINHRIFYFENIKIQTFSVGNYNKHIIQYVKYTSRNLHLTTNEKPSSFTKLIHTHKAQTRLSLSTNNTVI